jgi:hypothetical protein
MVAVIAHSFWMDRFGGKPDAIGQLLKINGRPYTIVGVAPEGFRGITLGSRPIVYVPMQSRVFVGSYNGLENRRTTGSTSSAGESPECRWRPRRRDSIR